MSDKIHGNSKKSKKKQHLYEIKDDDMPEDEDTYKYGISGQELNKKRTSGRANQQINHLNNESGYDKYSAGILHSDIDGRQDALDLEEEYVKAYYVKYNENPPGNIRPKIKKND